MPVATTVALPPIMKVAFNESLTRSMSAWNVLNGYLSVVEITLEVLSTQLRYTPLVLMFSPWTR